MTETQADTEQGLLWQSDGEDTHVAMSDAIPDAAFVVSRDNGGADWTVVDSDGALLPRNPPESFDSLPVAKQWCQRREEEMFEQTYEPEQPEPVEPDPDMPPEPEEDTIIPEELLDALEDAKRYLDEAAEKMEEMTNRRKYAKNELDEAQEEFNRAAQAVIAVRTKGFPADSPLGHAAAGNDATDEPQTEPTNWRDVPMTDLRMPDGAPISPRYIEAMREHEPPIATMGDFADWCETVGDFADWKGDFWAKDIANFGDEGRRQLEEAMAHFWTQHAAGNAQ